MRCSRTVCGKEGDGKFCNECGDEMIDEKMDTVVICPGKFDDGSPCGADLVPVQKFCKNCGVKVDQSLFTSLQDTCPECGKVLEQEAKFCIECGHRLKKPIVGGQHSSIVREVEYSGRIEKTDCKSRMESRADSKQNDSVETNHAVLLAGTRNVIEDGNIQDGKDINTERKENKSLKDDSSGHFEKRDENIIKSGCSGSENIDKAHSEMSENYSASSVNTEAVQSTENKSHLKPEDDTEMAVNESGMSDENKTGQPEISNNLTGNISIIHETSQTDLSEQLKEVHIGKSMHRNLNIVDSTKPASNDENMKEDIGTNNDDAKGGKEDAAKGGEDGTMEDESKKQTKTEDSKVKAAQRKFNEKCFTVQFHVLTSEDFHFDPAKDKCILRIGHEELGGWNRQDRIMKEKRKIDNYVYEMVYDEVIPTRLISGRHSISYKYMIVRSGKPDMVRWEYYLKNDKPTITKNRDLTVYYLNFKGLELWHQYDCFMENEPKSMRQMGFGLYCFTWKKTLIKHAERAVEIFCQDLMEHDKSVLTVDDTVQQLRMLSECMKKIYLVDGRCYLDNEDFSQNMSTFITTAFMKKANLKQMLTVETKEEKEKTTTAGLTLLYVLKTMELNMPNTESVRALAKALIVSADTDKKECPELQLADKLFPGKRKILLDTILAVIKNISGASKDPYWLCLLPWVHFLSDECVPFQASEVDVKHDQTQIWWGVSAIDRELEGFKKKRENWSIPAEKMLKLLQPLFEMDYLLPRSFIAAVDLADLEKVLETRAIPVEACLAYMTYMLNVTKPETCYDYGTCKFREISYAEQTVHRCIDSLLKQLQETFFSEDCVLSRWTMCYIIASHMLKRSMENKRLGTIQLCAQAFIHCIAMYDRVVAEQKTQDKEAKGHSNVLRENAKDVVRLVETYQRWHIEMEDILNVWNGVFAPVVLQSEDVGNTWNKIISEGLLQNLQRKVCKEKFIRQKFVELYCQKVDEYNRCMQECMSRAAFLAIAKEYTVDFGQFSPHEYKRFGSLISQLFISEWKKNVKTGKEEELSMLRHFLRWPPLSQYLKIYYKDQKKMEILTEDCLECLIQAISVIESKLIALLSGVLTIGEFSLIAEKDGKFPELAGLVHSKKEHTAAFVKKAIEIRQKELGAFQLLAKQMATLASVCTQLANVDMKCIDDTLKKQEHIERHQIKEFCEPADVTKVDIIETYKPRLCAFRVSPTVINIVPHLHACCESSTFMMFWNGQCQEVYNQCATLDDVVQKVWSVVKNRWDTIINRIYSGDIMFKDFEKVVGQRYRDSYDQMKVELRMMNIPERCIKERIDQLMNYRQLLEACVKGAKTILKFAQEYRLKGDFAQIRVIATHGDQDMKAFDNSVMKACEFLKDLTPDKEQCLKMFVICEPLVHWLKESMKKSGLKELKVFVDLAFMLARDEPISIARIQCLHSAVTGYAPLIFDLDESCGYKQLLNLSAVVWKELEANPKLPDKLKDTNRQLQWLKEIKKEVNSLMQAEAINANGIFTVGKNTWKKDAQSQNIDGTLMELKDTLKLTVPEQEGKRELRNYTFSQLQDLQSRLMLVTGKAEKRTDSVDRFTMIFDSITRLSSVYMKLCSSGCVLFKDWTARFFCDPEPNRPVCAVLEFGQGDGAPQLKVRRSETEDLQDIIPELANFMETCLEEWLKYINKKCKSYLHLNYFTVDQLVILQKELVKMGPDSEPSHLVYPLLSAVKDRCTPDDLLEAMAAAKEEIEGDAEIEVEEDGDSDNEEAETVEDSIEDEKKQSFVHELVQAGYEEARAIRALEFVDPEDVTAGIVWCMDHDDIEMSDEHDQSLPETLEPLREQLTQRPIFSGWSQSQTDIQTMITANIHVTGFGKQITVGSDPLISDLKALWNKFLESISSNIRDYLSLEHLGIILKYLAIKGDVLPTTLSVYMMDKDQPLPQSGEILMCTSQTTKDEVLTTIPKSSMIGIVDGCDSGYGDLKKTDCVVHGKDTEQTGSCELPCTTSCLHNADVQSEVLVKKGACGSEAVQCQIDIPTRKGTCPTNNGKATLTSSGMKSATSYDEFDQKRQFLEVEQQKLLIAKEQLELEKRKTELLEKSTILQTRSTEALESILVILREK
ncbi:E3 ubiquitin-protein ligase rnf213-alpha-like isoform X3 [Mercenaria mercenaria]|uniref:E3 ubiquitin-protein ligase rnf213-alpha-like isoform X3 n=1 Tax=Mercenaria mercenaria TaxID=6596 RepID=UPI00234E6B2C|nr:E3 ubiquitin-protein ligase rnf213-alpha-like isoform X3 [Mercenaria mercenaria]